MPWVSIANKFDNPKEWEWQLKKDPIKNFGKSIYSQQCSADLVERFKQFTLSPFLSFPD